ncbi:MAG: flagellar basal body rod protein FlgB [Waddliaceae bacterium]|nr:flagellar basal body rod protein FlgB [Waddliaceae bacterium]
MYFINKIGNKNFTLLGQLMQMHSKAHKVIAGNIANANTPYYRRQEFKFDTALREALSGGTSAHYSDIRGYTERPRNTPVRNNGNDVDMDMEMLKLRSNSGSYNMYAQFYQQKSAMVKEAIRGGR